MFIVLFSIIATNPNLLMEGEFEQMRTLKKLGLGFFGVLVGAGLIYALFSEPNYLPHYSMSMYVFAILDNFFNYNKDFKYMYICGLYLPKTILIFYIFYYPDTMHMGPTNSGELLPLLIAIFVICSIFVFQSFCHPRFFITTQYERELMKLIPKSMLLEDLLRDKQMGEEDVCGICLEPFNSKMDQTSSEIKESENENPSNTTEDHPRDDASSVQSIPTAVFSIEGRSASSTKTIIDKTHCNHIFHKTCLSAWIAQNENCPICRNTVLNKV